MENFEHLSRIFVVVDPTQMHQPAIEKAEVIAQAYTRQMHFYCCVHDHAGDDSTNAAEEVRERIISRTRRWLERLALASESNNVMATVQVDWHEDWAIAAARAAEAYKAQLLVKTTYRRSALRRALLHSSDARLLRACPCPALLVKTGKTWDKENRKILLALKAAPIKGEYALLNEWIADAGHVIGARGQFEMHGAHAYAGEGMFYDRRALATQCGLPVDKMHDVDASAHRGIVKIAEEIDADIVMIGTRQNVSELRMGDTVERTLDLLPMDVLVMPTSGSEQDDV